MLSALKSGLSKIKGEISNLRNYFPGIITTTISKPYKIDSSQVDYELARKLYYNTAEDYKLGGAFCKPIINTTVAFMGVPQFNIGDEDAQKALDDFFNDQSSKMQKTHRNALREGDCYVWLTREKTEDNILYPETDAKIQYNIIPPEQIKDIQRHPLTGKPIKYTLEKKHTWKDEKGNKHDCTITQIITAERRIIKIEGKNPPKLRPGIHENIWGFIPIVEFNNEKESYMANGQSDLEPVEPFIKAYHDVMKHAIQGSKMHSTPRLKLKLKHVEDFLRNNFGVTDPKEFIEEGKSIDLDGKELLILKGDEEDAEFIEVESAIGSAKDLLKFLFYCIVDVSETPEFVFGTHIKSSNASVKEQMPILIRRIIRKREQFTEQWQMMARMVLAMKSQAKAKKYSTHKATVLWDEIDPRDSLDASKELLNIVKALDLAIKGNIIGQESAVNYLKLYIDTMVDYKTDDPEIPGEREKIISTKILRGRLEDADLVDREKEMIQEFLDQLDDEAA